MNYGVEYIETTGYFYMVQASKLYCWLVPFFFYCGVLVASYHLVQFWKICNSEKFTRTTCLIAISVSSMTATYRFAAVALRHFFSILAPPFVIITW